MKVAFVVQRYGVEINGGAELHSRWIAEHMNKYWDVEVLTTKAFDYITWKDHYSKEEDIIHGVPVKRFPVNRPRNPERFGRIQDSILEKEHTKEEELKWLEEEGPLSSSLIRYIEEYKEAYDYFIFFSYRYFHSYWGIHAVPQKSILVPTAEHDSVIHLNLFKDFFRKPRAFVYNSVEEKRLIQSLSHNENVLSDVIGVGTEISSQFSSDDFREAYGIQDEYIVYIGRIDENKGCGVLFRHFLQFKKETGSSTKLILIGSSQMKIPSHKDIVYPGFLSEEKKFSALEGALLLVMPSYYESLSMVTLEAWALGRPVLANALCDVLKGQCMRSQAGLYYEDYEEFKEALLLLLSSGRLRKAMGENGKKYFEQNYAWETIEKKYLALFDRLEKEK